MSMTSILAGPSGPPSTWRISRSLKFCVDRRGHCSAATPPAAPSVSTPKKPTGTLDAHLEVGFGDYDQRRVKATFDTPEWNGFAARITIFHAENSGYVKNSAAGTSYVLPDPFGTITAANTFGENDETGVAAAISYSGIDRLTFDYKFDYTTQTQSQLATQGLGFASSDSFQQLLVANQAPGAVPISTSRLSSLPLGFNTPGTLMVIGHSLTGEYELTSDISLKSITAYRSMREFTGGNAIDGGTYTGTTLTSAYLGVPVGTPWTLIDSIAKRAQHQWSEEAQIIGTEDKFSWIAGFYYFDEVGYQNDPVLSAFFGSGILTPAALATEVKSPGAFALGALDGADNLSLAGYAHATFHATDSVDVAGGVRFTNDQRTYNHLVPGNVFTHNADFSNTDWDASVTYKFRPDASIYGKISTGYLAGGALGTGPSSLRPSRPMRRA